MSLFRRVALTAFALLMVVTFAIIVLAMNLVTAAYDSLRLTWDVARSIYLNLWEGPEATE